MWLPDNARRDKGDHDEESAWRRASSSASQAANQTSRSFARPRPRALGGKKVSKLTVEFVLGATNCTCAT